MFTIVSKRESLLKFDVRIHKCQRSFNLIRKNNDYSSKILSRQKKEKKTIQ